MANIAVLNYCNLQCPYCFANKFITEEEKEFITDEQLETILKFLSKNKPGDRIGVIGGEPTIHPNFKNILKRVSEFSKQHNFMQPTVFSNGIKLGEFVDLFKEAHVLVNVNEPAIIGEANWNAINKSLKRFEAYGLLDHVSLGINLYPDMQDYIYILELAKKFRKTDVRCSYVAPTCKFNDIDKDKYYTEAKPLFINFVHAAAERNIDVKLDCNCIPECYFTEDELAFLREHIFREHSFCNPVIDISPDMKATACFGAYHLVDATKFNNEEELRRYLMFKEMYKRNLANGTGKCKDCEKFENLSCQGGCLAFAKVED